MRLTSNEESVAKGEVSVLAIVETLLAIALVFYLSAHFDTMRWLSVAMCVSPLLLLRTEESTRLGIELWDHACTAAEPWFQRKAQLETLTRYSAEEKRLLMAFWYHLLWSLCCVWTVLILVSAPPLARIAATVSTFLRHPWAAFQAIPKNWSRVALATDSLLSPEPVPGAPRMTPSRWRKSALKGRTGLNRLVCACIGVPLLFVILFLPALIYRWSLKATSIIYAPLVFIARSTFGEGTDLRTKLELIKRSDLTRIRALYGVVFIVAFLVKLVLMMKWSGFVEAWKGNPITEFLSLYIAPPEIPKWQIAELVNSVLAVGAMLFARQALLHYDLNHPYPEKSMRRILGFVSGVRWVLVVYAVVCIGYITMREAHNWHWPALGTKWLPFW
jgi:hypothetical protein